MLNKGRFSFAAHTRGADYLYNIYDCLTTFSPTNLLRKLLSKKLRRATKCRRRRKTKFLLKIL